MNFAGACNAPGGPPRNPEPELPRPAPWNPQSRMVLGIPRKPKKLWFSRHPTQMWAYGGTSVIRNSPLPSDHHSNLGIVLLQGPRRRLFLMSEVPL